MRIFFDTEFTTLQPDVDACLISAGFVSEEGSREFYAEITDFPRHECSQFVREVVLPLLDAPAELRFTEAMFAMRLVEWLNEFDEPVDLFSDSPTDWYLLGDAIRDARGDLRHPLKAYVTRAESPDALEAEYRFWQQPENKGKLHHALFDARCLRQTRLALENELRERMRPLQKPGDRP